MTVTEASSGMTLVRADDQRAGVDRGRAGVSARAGKLQRAGAGFGQAATGVASSEITPPTVRVVAAFVTVTCRVAPIKTTLPVPKLRSLLAPLLPMKVQLPPQVIPGLVVKVIWPRRWYCRYCRP